MTDKRIDEVALRHAWRPLSHRFAVATGSFVALVSLLHHVSVATASLRGAGAFVATLFVARLGLLAMEKTVELDNAHELSEDEQ
jgi:hypothetical protein